MDVLEQKDRTLWQELQAQSEALERSMDKLHRKQTGSYYTALELALAMMRELVESFDLGTRGTLYEKRFLEPCVGSGNFVFAYLRVCRELDFSRSQYEMLLDHIYVCDINQEALALYRKNLTRVARAWFDLELGDAYFSTHMGAGLLFDVDGEEIRYLSAGEVLGKDTVRDGFDIVVTNPPYKNLKAERSHYATEEERTRDKEKYAKIGELAARHFSYSTAGTLNLYKLFVEEILERYLAPNGVCALLLASSILSDKTCTKLRTRILETCSLRSLRLISENNSCIDASQALCAMLFHKGQRTDRVYLDGSFSGDMGRGSYASLEDILDEATGNALLVLSDNEYRIRSLMKQHPTIRELPYIENLRGELDITANKRAIVQRETPYKLLRGRHIGYYRTIRLPEQEYVTGDFVQVTAKKRYIFENRLVCQQIVNMARKRRLSFALVPPGCVLGNSCNFISVNENPEGVDLYFLMGILNSTLMDWYFKLTSSNNHINNYEIDNFPIPVSFPRKGEIGELVRTFLESGEEGLLARIDALVYEAFGIAAGQERSAGQAPGVSAEGEKLFHDREAVIRAFHRDLNWLIPGIRQEECRAIVECRAAVRDISFQRKPEASRFQQAVLENMEKKYRKLYHGQVLNHTTSKLSELDLEMIRPVPQGGSWKDIPMETVHKSKRLERIRQTGGRTTLYGRIDYTKPSYTITTYFNRPGNGTYVHPVHDRVVSVREAARFQSFPDDYLFCGNKSDMLKQVGNAVPVLLAYSIGKRIREKTGCRTSVDLFSGAGGMTYGFKRAGIQAVIANDFAESACVTLKTNCPEIPVLCGDITDEATKKAIIEAGRKAKADMICGGPPCQGFSLAGFRMKDDPRNELFRHFVDIVSGVKPKVIVFENVEGILSYQQGETYRNIIALFSELGYNTEGRKLLANQYGVPQRRKRVILLCTHKDLPVMPGELFPEPVTPNMDRQVTAYETIYDLEKVACSEQAKYNSTYTSPMLRYLKGETGVEAYLKSVTDPRGVLQEGADIEKQEEAEAFEQLSLEDCE